jgi:hypothetical protein
VKAGIAPELLVRQVKNTAAWLWHDERAAPTVRVLDDFRAAEASARGAEGNAYLALLLAAHRATAATFRADGRRLPHPASVSGSLLCCRRT